VIFVHPKNMGGVLVELMETPPTHSTGMRAKEESDGHSSSNALGGAH
jgi:hypothetical protein